MIGQFNHLLQRGARLRQRFEAERARERHNPLLLLRLRNLLLRIEQRMHGLIAVQRNQGLRLQPVIAGQPRAHRYG